MTYFTIWVAGFSVLAAPVVSSSPELNAQRCGDQPTFATINWSGLSVWAFLLVIGTQVAKTASYPAAPDCT
jgi:hypothetical protein